MNTTILQVPMDKDFRDSVQKRAEETGFSSLQDFLRFVMTQFLDNKYTVSIVNQPNDEILTEEQERMLNKQLVQAKKDIASGKGVTVSTVDEMMKYLRS